MYVAAVIAPEVPADDGVFAATAQKFAYQAPALTAGDSSVVQPFAERHRALVHGGKFGIGRAVQLARKHLFSLCHSLKVYCL